MSDEPKASLLAGVSDTRWDEMTRTTFVFIRSADEALDKDKLLGIAQKRAADPSIFDERPPWFGRFCASTYRIDSYWTRADRTSLKNYAEDMDAGKALLVGHETRTPTGNLGMSLRGEYEAHGYKPGGVEKDGKPFDPAGIPWAYGDYMLLRGKEPQDGMIDAFRASTQDQFSVGFQPGWWRCQTCKRDLFDWDCPHIPGRYYDAKDSPVLDPSAGTLAFADLVDMRLRELSTVYSGATPGATLLKAERMVESGHVSMDRKAVEHLERLYRHKMPGSERIYQAAKPAEREASAVEGDNKETTGGKVPEDAAGAAAAATVNADAVLMIDRAELESLGLPKDATASALIEAFKTHRKAGVDVAEYRAEAIKEALHEGKRALGVNFTEERYARMLGGLSITDISEQRREWTELAKETFAQGRKTEERSDRRAKPAPSERAAERPSVPMTAYGARA